MCIASLFSSSKETREEMHRSEVGAVLVAQTLAILKKAHTKNG